MKLTICAIGRLKNGPERELWQRYAKRIDAVGKAQAVGPLNLIELSEARDTNAQTRKRNEADRITAKIDASSRLVALDERGAQITSKQIASALQSEVDAGRDNLTFVIGGPDGLAPEFIEKTHAQWALGRITLPHGIVRAILAEQLYRALTIMSNHPYHRA